jgi:serine/threonine-protein kinase
MAPLELMPKARIAAEKAMELNESLAEAHVSLAAVRAIYDWDWAGSEAEFRRAMELDPDCAPAYQWCGVLCLMPQGRLKEAETAIRRALDLDPLSPAINTSSATLTTCKEGMTTPSRIWKRRWRPIRAFIWRTGGWG